MICVSNVDKSFVKGSKALDGLCINVDRGSIYGLVGTNGAGKTTIIRSIMGILKVDAGDITVCGEPVYDNAKAKQKLGYVSDDPFAFRGYSLREMGNYTAGFYPAWSEERFGRLAAEYGLDPKAKLSSFSKGMRKQAAFTLALSAMPEVLVLDEPIDGLDPIVRRKTWKYIIDDVAEREMTVLVSSHNLREMEDYCDHIGIIDAGRMVIERDLEDLKTDVHKVQTAFKDTDEDTFGRASEGMRVLHRERRGSVDIAIIREPAEKIEAAMRAHDPAVFDLLPLTLEEIFIYEIGGDDYEISSIIK